MARKISFELALRSGHDFQNYFSLLLGELIGRTAETKRLGHLDRLGVDAIIVDNDDESIDTIIQCKGFEVVGYGADQHRQCRDEIKKFRQKGPRATNYWLVVNRPITDRSMREELFDDLAKLVRSGKADRAELLDKPMILKRLTELASNTLISWAEIRRKELFEFYRKRMEIVRHLDDVPFNDTERDPASSLMRQLTSFFERIAESQTGKYRHAPKVLVTSEFGFGKTTTLQALAQKWIDSDRHLIYAPAALLGSQAFTNASGLADGLLQLILPEEAKLSDSALLQFRDVLRDLLTRSKDWLVLIDGLDENSYAFRPDSLAQLWSCIADLGIPAVLSARNEIIDVRPSDFQPSAYTKTGPQFDRIELGDWDESLMLTFVDRFAPNRSEHPSVVYANFRDLIASGKYGEIYGDIPKRPLFLGMLVEDAWSGKEPARHLHRLYGTYFRNKFELDRISVGAAGAQNRPSEIVARVGRDQAVELLINLMQEAADRMLEIVVSGDTTTAVHRDTISETDLREISNELGLPYVQVEDIVMHSLLQPSGRDRQTGHRSFRFAHRSFQDWFLARQFAAKRREPYFGLPPLALAFLDAMRNDLNLGKALP